MIAQAAHFLHILLLIVKEHFFKYNSQRFGPIVVLIVMPIVVLIAMAESGINVDLLSKKETPV